MNELTQLIIHRHFVNLGSTGGKRNTAAQQAARKLNAAKGAAARRKKASENEPQPGAKTS